MNESTERGSLLAAERLAELEDALVVARAAYDDAATALRKAHQAWKEAHMVAHPESWTEVRLVRQRDDGQAISNPVFGL